MPKLDPDKADETIFHQSNVRITFPAPLLISLRIVKAFQSRRWQSSFQLMDKDSCVSNGVEKALNSSQASQMRLAAGTTEVSEARLEALEARIAQKV